MTTFRAYLASGRSDTPLNLDPKTLPPGASSIQGDRAGFVSRAVAAFIDLLLILIIVFGTAGVLWVLSFVVNPVNPTSTVRGGIGERLPSLLVFVVYAYFLNWLYWTVCWAKSGRTIGNLLMGLRVVSRRGAHLGWGMAAVRALFCTAFPFGLLWVIVSGANRSVQDVVVRTSVTYDWVLGFPTLSSVLGHRGDSPREQAS